MKVNMTCTTNGKGLWSNEKKAVAIKELGLTNLFIDATAFCVELRAFFKAKDWDVNHHGLIYTDKGWMQDFKKELRKIGFSPKAIKEVGYSEQGMQGDEYVSMDAGKNFLEEFIRLGGSL